jgi:Transposase
MEDHKEVSMSKEKEPASGALEGARRATGGAPEERRDGRGRWSAKRKYAAVLRVLRGEDLETLSRELGVTAAALSGWRDQFLEGGAANLKAREVDVDDEETQRLKSLVADLSMSNELLREKIHRMEAGRPLVWRRSKP